MKHIIKLALVALAAVAAYFVYGFTVHVAPVEIALFAACSLVGTYIGLAFADIPAHQRDRAQVVARVACGIEAAYGVLYVLHQQSPQWFAAPMPVAVSVPLALLHGGAFDILAYFVSLFVVHERASVQADPNADALREMRLILRDMRVQADAVELSRLPAPAPMYALPDVHLARQDTYTPPVAVHDARTSHVQASVHCACGCSKALSASEIGNGRKRKRGH